MAATFSRERLAPMIRDSPALRDRVSDPEARDGSNTISEKFFPGAYAVLIGANSPADLSSRSVPIILGDEMDLWTLSAGGIGNPLSLLEKRQSNFYNRKTVLCSTPTTETGRIWTEWLGSDQSEWCVECPGCGHAQALTFGALDFDTLSTTICKYDDVF